MSNLPFNLTRNQLASFLPNHRTVIAFEQMLMQLNDNIPSDLETVAIEAASASTNAQSALDTLGRIADALELLATKPETEPRLSEDDVKRIVQEALAVSIDLSPPSVVGTLGQQQSDRVSINGGLITAGITDNTATLISSSVALNNGAGALAGTLLNSPVAGNPTKWISINDNGTTRYVPIW